MKSKIINDLAYGFIKVDVDELKVIDHRSFQRLKNLSQLTAHHLYPSANHTRFEHSLGVMHLAMKFMDALEGNLGKLGKDAEIQSDRMHLKYAALLHDVGHAPMSHVGEAFYKKEEIYENLGKIIDGDVKAWCRHGSPHELMSCYVIARNFKEILDSIFIANEEKLDLEYIFRIITGTKYNTNQWNRNIMIKIVNSNSIDVDKIDYLIRDNIMVGGVAPNINLERFFYSITIDSNHKATYSPVGISSIISIIDSRDFLYMWVYNHHIVVYTDYLYQTAIKHLSNEENKKSPYKISIADYFSCDAISEHFVADDDIRVILNKEYSETESIYSKKVLSQLFERNFLKPIWKTLFDFNKYMDDHFDDREKAEVYRYIEKEDFSIIAAELIKECGVIDGELFVIKRSNKFYAMSNNADFYINVNGENVALTRIVPNRRFDYIYSNITFYVFTLPDKIETTKEKLAKVIKEHIC